VKNFIQLKPHGVPAIAVAGALVLAGAAAAHGSGRSSARAATHFYSHRIERPTFRRHRLVILGTQGSDKIALRLEAGRPDVLQVDVGDDGSPDFSFRLEPIGSIVVDAGAGDDLVRIDESNGAFTNSIPTTIAGGTGNDTLLGGSGGELFLGGAGSDTVYGNGGNDVADLGAGDDSFVWDPGDGSDAIEGGAGSDTMVFNGAAASEQVTLSANGSHLKFVRDLGNITMDTHGVEQVDFNALGGADLVTVNDLAGTDVSGVRVDLAGALGGTAGDGQADRVVVNATNGNDAITVDGDAGGIKGSGLAASVEILHAEAANDRLEINTLAGRDTVDSGGLAAGAIQLLVNGVAVR
jgi:hypothetical protein